ncbi:MAG: gliding motility lipoprotein GldB [Flavobacteriaceae bacterium]|nr:gliding motility lipoprotein GldB [Flavobacteriaceae bacterium]|tara:strand:+ start:25 stop:987 length:963 start_codon:yes stop_codon:yes gene_type:complete
MTIFLPNYIKNLFFFSSIIFFVSACKNEIQNKIKVNVDRFDKKFQLSDSLELQELKQNYPYFFPTNYPDEVWMNRKKDSIQIEIFNEVENVFNEAEFLNDQLSNFFSRKKKYYKKFRLPKIISLITDVDYDNRVILTDSILLIGLDNYLGSDHYFYDGLPNFIKEDLKKENIISDIAEEYARKSILEKKMYTFLEKILYHGKILYYKDIMIPNENDYLKIGISQNKLDWAIANESKVWGYFIENEILFNPDINLEKRFIDDAPFSKFFLEIDNDSTEKIGRFIGWNIVRSFMKNNNISFQKMLQLDYKDIYYKSKYKPIR